MVVAVVVAVDVSVVLCVVLGVDVGELVPLVLGVDVAVDVWLVVCVVVVEVDVLDDDERLLDVVVEVEVEIDVAELVLVVVVVVEEVEVLDVAVVVADEVMDVVWVLDVVCDVLMDVVCVVVGVVTTQPPKPPARNAPAMALSVAATAPQSSAAVYRRPPNAQPTSATCSPPVTSGPRNSRSAALRAAAVAAHVPPLSARVAP